MDVGTGNEAMVNGDGGVVVGRDQIGRVDEGEGGNRPTGAGASHSPYYTAPTDVPGVIIRQPIFPRTIILFHHIPRRSIVGTVACPCPRSPRAILFACLDAHWASPTPYPSLSFFLRRKRILYHTIERNPMVTEAKISMWKGRATRAS